VIPSILQISLLVPITAFCVPLPSIFPTDVCFVDVKYRKILPPLRVLELANKVEQTWPGAWLFLATLDGFYFAPCAEIQSRGGAVPPLPTKWIS
jgi:hypothetical protein